eukprot:scaffold1306_cov22-Prasinocladus_malaysianus.AAC.1
MNELGENPPVSSIPQVTRPDDGVPKEQSLHSCKNSQIFGRQANKKASNGHDSYKTDDQQDADRLDGSSVINDAIQRLNLSDAPEIECLTNACVYETPPASPTLRSGNGRSGQIHRADPNDPIYKWRGRFDHDGKRLICQEDMHDAVGHGGVGADHEQLATDMTGLHEALTADSSICLAEVK